MTLSEVIVVITILGILILLAALSLRPRYQIAKARDSRRKADLKTLSIAFEDYVGDNPCYPSEDQINNCEPGTGLKPYLNKIPCDPLSKQSYVYKKFACNQYAIYATLELEGEIEYGVGNYAVSSSNLRVIPTMIITPTSAPGPGIPTTTPTLGPTPTIDVSGTFFGCRSGVCVPLSPPPPPLCSPNYQGYPNCDPGEVNLCGSPEAPKNECN